MKFIDMTGKTEEEAISKALAELGLDRDDVSVEILERAKRGIFGIGAVPAKVQVTYEAPDLKPAAPVEEKPAAPKVALSSASRSKPKAPKAEKPQVEEPKVEAPKAPKVEAPKVETPKAPKTEAPKAEKPKTEKKKYYHYCHS